MARYNPDLMQLDDGATGAPRVAGPRNDTSQITEAEIQAASIAAAKELAMTPYTELTAAERKAMTQAEKTAYIEAAREEQARIAAEERAASDPMLDFTNRPDAPADPKGNFINYYAWVGGVTSGQWKLYRAPNTPENQAKYGARSIGGTTQATPDSAVGANALINQPQPIKDDKGNITGWSTDGSTSSVNTVNTVNPVTSVSSTTTTTNPTSFTASDGKTFTDQQAYVAYQANLANQKAERQSAYDLLFQQFNQYGLGALVTPLKDLITSGASPSEFTIKLRETDAYKKRFAANAARIAKGLTAISEAEYIGLEDQYQNIMRNYGLPANYYTRGDMGRQEGFEKFIGNDVSAAELEDRIMTAQNRVMNANPEVVASLRQFYPDISNGDILAYALDPDKGLSEIKRKVTAAEIGGAATQAGLGITGTRAEELGAAGVTKQQAQQGFQTVAEVFPRGGQLAAIYGESPYTQTTAEQEVFGLTGSTEAAKQRKKLVGLERAAFSGQTGTAQGALGRERAGVL